MSAITIVMFNLLHSRPQEARLEMSEMGETDYNVCCFFLN